MDRKLLSIYLNDHFAGATAGVELAKRSAQSNQGTELGKLLQDVADELIQDRDELRNIIVLQGFKVGRFKARLGWVAEKLGRLKLNGRIFGYSDLSRLVELEGLCGGVQVKLSLWENLQQVNPKEGLVGSDVLHTLTTRAHDQFERLRSARQSAAMQAFS